MRVTSIGNLLKKLLRFGTLVTGIASLPGFRKFRQIYNGVVPSGPWAKHFSIIAWPITHAVLPRYLQQQFARALYDLRFMLLQLTLSSPKS